MSRSFVMNGTMGQVRYNFNSLGSRYSIYRTRLKLEERVKLVCARGGHSALYLPFK
jgi:hypothetical protein